MRSTIVAGWAVAARLLERTPLWIAIAAGGTPRLFTGAGVVVEDWLILRAGVDALDHGALTARGESRRFALRSDVGGGSPPIPGCNSPV